MATSSPKHIKVAGLTARRRTGHAVVTVTREGNPVHRYRITLRRFALLKKRLNQWFAPARGPRPQFTTSGFIGSAELSVSVWLDASAQTQISRPLLLSAKTHRAAHQQACQALLASQRPAASTRAFPGHPTAPVGRAHCQAQGVEPTPRMPNALQPNERGGQSCP